MKKLSGMFDYVMRRKKRTLGLLIVLTLVIVGVSWAFNQEDGFLRGDFGGGSETVACDSGEMTAAELGGGATLDDTLGPAEAIASLPKQDAEPEVVAGVTEMEVPRTGETEAEQSDLGVPQTGEMEDEEGLFGLIVSVVVGVMVAMGLLKFVSDHYIR